jgi:hypothetical protein
MVFSVEICSADCRWRRCYGAYSCEKEQKIICLGLCRWASDLQRSRRQITDLDGKEINFGAGRSMEENLGMAAANESAHARVLEAVGGLLKDDLERE